MPHLTPHTLSSAPQRSRPHLEAVEKSLGFIPNLFATLAESPATLEGYLALDGAYGRGALSAAERQLVLIAASTENDCGYCVAAHSTIAGLVKVPPAILAAVRNEEQVSDPKLEALVRLTRALVRERGRVPESDIEAFLRAGYDQEQLLEVIVGVGLKTIANYVNHIAETPLDPAFAGQEWRKGALTPR
ncbi:MAG: carboxymuconolactone decarboxylase family protein [Gemmatimonadales bacterium]